MTDVASDESPPAADLREVVATAVEREGHLLAAGEVCVVRRILALQDAPLTLYARLLSRVGPVFRVGRLDYGFDAAAAVADLAEAGLVEIRLPDDRCAGAFTSPELGAACRALGLPATGSRTARLERLRGRRWNTEAVVMCRHAALVARLERLYFQRPWMDRTSLLLERLGAVRWATYTPTGGAGLHRDRRAMLTWERAATGQWEDPDEPLRIALAGPGADPLTPWRRAVDAVMEADPDAATLLRLAWAGAPVLPRLALTFEQEGRPEDALEVCRGRLPPGPRGDHPPAATDPAPPIDMRIDLPIDPATRIALSRTGARLARSRGRSWPPLDLRPARQRVLRLPRGQPPAEPRGARPSWQVDGVEHLVERAVLAAVARSGREGVHAENALWTSLYALVFRDLYFLPIPGMLPTARRDGPLDVGTPGFAQRRVSHVEARLAALLKSGCAPFVAAWGGERLAGLVLPGLARRCAPFIPPAMAVAVLRRLVKEGWGAATGLPDLLIFPGPRARIGGLLPAELDVHAILAEVKGEGDTLRDGQRVWMDVLVRADVPVELWAVRADL